MARWLFLGALFVCSKDAFAFPTIVSMVSSDGRQMLTLECTERDEGLLCARSKVLLRDQEGNCTVLNRVVWMEFKKTSATTWKAALPTRVDTLTQTENEWAFVESENGALPGSTTNFSSRNLFKIRTKCRTVIFGNG